jgi:uncharacterized protein YdaU (DUF1376 family)
MRGLPYVPFFTSDWLASSARVDMTLPERAVYLDLLFQIWERGGAIPSDHAKLARLALVTMDEFSAAWPAVSKHIIQHPDEPDALTNLKMLDVIQKQASNYQAKANSGRLGGVASGVSRKRKRTENEAKTNHLEPELEPELETELERTHTQRACEFLALYPKKTGRAKALRAYKVGVSSEALHEEVMAGLRRHLASARWRESLGLDGGRYVPDAHRFISERRWLDQPAAARPDAFEEALKL